jgi:hypothetical protein
VMPALGQLTTEVTADETGATGDEHHRFHAQEATGPTDPADRSEPIVPCRIVPVGSFRPGQRRAATLAA